MKIPDSVKGDDARTLYNECNTVRKEIKEVAARVEGMRKAASFNPSIQASVSFTTEVPANITLAFRHLEDASMRLGKALQALDGGVSVYDKDTTVGA